MPDYLIVGAGSAGCVLAARLTEDPGTTVLLVEEGPDWRPPELPDALRFPVQSFSWSGNPDERFLAPGLQARRQEQQEPWAYQRGRGLGGSSTINGCYAIRPPMEELDEWAGAGYSGWSSADLLPYFARLEADVEFGDRPAHRADGPVAIRRFPTAEWGGFESAFADAALAAGHPSSPDLNAPGAFGLSPFPASIDGDRRVTTNDAYLDPVRGRANLTVLGGVRVVRVVLDGTEAVGVEIADGEGVRTLRAGRIVLAAGSVGTPAILQRSGIGDPADLAAAGVAVRHALPVGHALQDHAGFEFRFPVDTALASPVGRKRADVTLRYTSGLGGAGDVLISPLNAIESDGMAGILAMLGQNHSRGRLTIGDADPSTPPRIEQRLLSDAADRALALRMYRDLGDIVGEFAPGIIGDVLDGQGRPIGFDLDDAGFDAWSRTIVRDTAHMTSTSRMGPAGDPGAVLDLDCRVLGLDALWVVDAAALPFTPRANVHLTVIALAERMADVLRGRPPVETGSI